MDAIQDEFMDLVGPHRRSVSHPPLAKQDILAPAMAPRQIPPELLSNPEFNRSLRHPANGWPMSCRLPSGLQRRNGAK
jgi:hypothetical protein